MGTPVFPTQGSEELTMRLSLKHLIPACVLALGSSMAMAVPVTPPSTFTGTDVDVDGDNGGFFVAVWDVVRNVSIVEYLGVNLAAIATNPAPGFSLEFGQLGQWSATFGTSNSADLRYALFA